MSSPVETSRWEYEFNTFKNGGDYWVRRATPEGTKEAVLAHITRECRNHPEKLSRYRVVETQVTVHTPKIEVLI